MRAGVAVFGSDGISRDTSSSIYGTVSFLQTYDAASIVVDVDLYGFEPYSIHGFHIHEYGDMTDGCESMGGHFNPDNTLHGSYEIHGRARHVGDLINNLHADENGEVHLRFSDSLPSLYGSNSIYGRGLVIHENADDLGIGGDDESLRSGNAGKRIACAIIAVAKPFA